MCVILFLPRRVVLKVKVYSMGTVYCLCQMADAEMDLSQVLSYIDVWFLEVGKCEFFQWPSV